MSRPLRIEYSGAWYHIMNRGRRAERIFEEDSDHELFLTLLRETALLWDVRVSAFCLMDNHYHLLIQTPHANLSRFMRHLNGVYTQRYNRLYGYDGQLFRGRYKSILVAEDNNLLELLRYIHLNPVRAAMVKSPDKYRWSSHQGYLLSTDTWAWLHKSFLLNMLSKKTGRQKKAYLDFMEEKSSERYAAILARPKWPSMLGGEEFKSWVKAEFFQEKQSRQVPESFRLAPDRRQIIRTVCQLYGMSENDLLRSRRGDRNEPRDIAIYLCRLLCNDTLSELGKTFGITGYAPAGRAVDRIRKRLSEDVHLEQRVKYIRQCCLGEDKVSK